MQYGDCAGAVLWRQEKLLLGKRSPHRIAYPNCWDVLGGRVEPGETFQQALIREVQEEVGLLPRRFRELAVMVEPEGAILPVARYRIYVVDEWDGGEPTMLGHEHTELRWFTIAEACAQPDLALSCYRDLFRRIARNPSDEGSR